ncbi:MAG: hypothetical protein IJU23_01790 [Proteobacteria bacterium]|nr:hypothetical protein [Pseudomonadota bacterium]
MKYVRLMIPVLFCATLATTSAFAQDETVAEVPVQTEEAVQTTDAGSVEDVQPVQEEQAAYEEPVQDSYADTAYEQTVQNDQAAYEQPVQAGYVQPISYSAGNTANYTRESYWNPGFSISAKIGPELEVAGFLGYWVSYGGLSGGIELGYHWDVFGLYVSQQFSGTWGFNDDQSFDSAEDEDDYNKRNSRYSSAMGMTAIDVRWFLGEYDKLRFSVGCGLGLEYVLRASTMDDDDGTAIIPLIRLHFGVHYLMTPNFSLGFRLDYSGFVYWIVHFHQIEPAFTVTYTF